MFWNKKSDSNPLGVALGELAMLLQPTSIKTTLKGNTLSARHEHYTIRIEVVPPETRESENGPIRAVVRMITELPKPLLALFQGKESDVTATYNAFAALGSLCADHRNVYIGSRLTIYEADDAWRTLHLPLLLFTTICGTEAILGALRRSLTNEGPRKGTSTWTERDFAQVQGYLSKVSLCNIGGLGLTAEFGLEDDAVSAALGHETALFQLMADQPHPELGGGLFCLLQMPHQLRDKSRLNQVCQQLNNMEMAAQDLPPHFGAWCPGRLGNNPAYISFFPNPLYSASGIAVNAGFWAMCRAKWANDMLTSLGVRNERRARAFVRR